MGNYQYKAFISYSHKDERWGRWLHRRLETYPIPRNLVGRTTKTGIVPKRLKPIFRDREELAAADSLGKKIEQALADSESLIVICSPNAAKSHWVNQEVLSFKRNNRSAKIFSLIVGGEPFASNQSGREAEECFPPALRFNVGSDGRLTKQPAEPLAADIRAQGDGKRLGVLKLVSGMIGVNLDAIIQRDMRRGRKRVMAITASALAVVLVMGTLTGFALSARKDAEARRNDAEGLIEFMLTDLKENLDSVGRLDVLQTVSFKAAEYYASYPIAKHDADALGRRARVFHSLGDVDDRLGDIDKAEKHFEEAYASTKLLLEQSPNDVARIFEHAQSAYWLGYIPYQRKDYKAAHTYFLQYVALSERLVLASPNNPQYKFEMASAKNTYGALQEKQEKYIEALKAFESAAILFAEILDKDSTNIAAAQNYTDTLGWASKIHSHLGNRADAKAYRLQEIAEIIRILETSNSIDWATTYILAAGYRNLSRLEYIEGDALNAINYATESENIFIKLTDHDPDNTQWLKGLAYSQTMLIQSQLLAKDQDAVDISRKRLSKTLAKLQPHSQITEREIIRGLRLVPQN